MVPRCMHAPSTHDQYFLLVKVAKPVTYFEHRACGLWLTEASILDIDHSGVYNTKLMTY